MKNSRSLQMSGTLALLANVEKSIEDRHEEYLSIFNLYGYDETDDFNKMWSDYLIASPRMESTGWLARWKLSKASCFKYDVNFGSSFLVMVNQVDYTSLSADVELINDVENKRFDQSQKLSVSLLDLYILKKQNNEILFAADTAECLDQLRVFYKYLWWPWDAHSSESTNWFSMNLQRRLKLYNDLTLGNYSEPIVKHIKALIEKGRLFHDAYMKESESLPMDEEADVETQKKIVMYVKSFELIKASLRIFLDDDQSKNSLLRRVGKSSSNTFLAVKEFDLKNVIHCTHEIGKLYPTSKLKKVGKELEDALNQYDNYDIIFLAPGEHSLGYGCLNANVTVRNSTADTTVLNGNSSFWYFLKTSADNICLQNLVIRSQENLVLVYIKEGVTLLDSITMMGSVSKQQKAIIVGERATLLANKCQFDNFSSAIICLSGSAVQLTDCVFQNNSVAIEIIGDAQLCLNNVTASKSGKAFIRFEGDTPLNILKPLSELSNIPSINCNSVKVDNENVAVQFV